jgi:hypothetical protein
MVIGSLVSYWIGFAIGLIALIGGLLLLFMNKCEKGLRDLIAASTLIFLLLFSSYLTLILDQGYLERSDNVDVEWSRFAFLIAMSIFLTLMVSKYLWHELVFRWIVLSSFILTTTYLLFSVISVGSGIYVWAILSFLTLVFGLVTVLVFSKRRDFCAFILIGLIVLSILIYLILIILSPACTNVVSWELFDWIIVFIDLLLFIIIPFVIIFTYKLIPCSCAETKEKCCPPNIIDQQEYNFESPINNNNYANNNYTGSNYANNNYSSGYQNLNVLPKTN